MPSSKLPRSNVPRPDLPTSDLEGKPSANAPVTEERFSRVYASTTSDSDLKVQPSNAAVIEVIVNAARPSVSTVPKIIRGDFFTAASNLDFNGEGDYNQIEGDYVDEVYEDDTTSFDTEDNPESVVAQGRTAKGKALARPTMPTGPTPELAPGTVVEGEFFAGAHHFTVGGTARFNAVKGNFVKTRSNRRNAPNGATRRRPAPPTQASPPIYEQRETPVVKGKFFAAAHTAVFDGNHEFNSISGDMIQTKYTFEADKHDVGYTDENP
ncbi:hypothetical protein D9757_011117 [Collybiopsis confluens]|uniref:Uncharacterized protein n=1 Tax=Collybiopsis confluens TaxID=2823264 RepID=A0A8H5GXF1_9AGAR|nr:hypothetical protein D9757_011117 [Collybiopsis confluens]